MLIPLFRMAGTTQFDFCNLKKEKKYFHYEELRHVWNYEGVVIYLGTFFFLMGVF